MTIYFLFFIATIVAGAINALAGGGGLITFPLLALVVPLATADATSAVALLCAYPAAVWRTRSELAEVPNRLIWLLLVPSVLGGLIGALLLSWSGDRNFVVLVPWLVLVATLLILVRPLLVPQSANGEDRHPLHFSPALWAVAALSLFLVALYGGYLGGLASHRANRTVVRWTVIGIGFGVAAYYFWRLYGPPVMYVGGE